MNQILDRKRRRREYLQQKGNFYLRAAVFACIVIYEISGVVHSLLTHRLPLQTPLSLAVVIGLGLVVIAIRYVKTLRDAYQQANRAYAPPVTPDTLPAEELLVRSSGTPSTVQNELLLRAATERETPKEELLKVVGG